MLSKNEVLQNRYKITRRLGQGGMGAVYEAKDIKRFGKAIALKEILIDEGEEANPSRRRFLKRAFESEAKILAALEHECFPQVIDYFVESERQFLVMELVQGENLSKLLDDRQTFFSTAEVLNWAGQLLDALDYLHTLPRAVFHRDIKPQNLKLTKRGRIKLLDFGIAKSADAGVNLTLTNKTFIAATLHYSPLEQIIKAVDVNYREFLQQKFGEKFVKISTAKTDASGDIYALGATLYHLLTNSRPVDALRRALKIFDGADDPLPDPQELNPQIPAGVSEWILQALEIESENRFPDAKQMLSALEEVLEAEKFRRERELLREEYLRIEEERENLVALSERFYEASNLSETNEEFLFDESEVEDFIDKTLPNYTIESEKLLKVEEPETVPPVKSTAAKTLVLATFAAFIFILFGGLGLGIWFVAGESDIDLDDLEVGSVAISATPVLPPVEENIEIAVQPTLEPTPEVKRKDTVNPKKTDIKPIPTQTPKKDKEKKQNYVKPVTVDDIINDN